MTMKVSSTKYAFLIDGNNFFVSSMMGVLSYSPNTEEVMNRQNIRADKRYGLFLHTLLTGIESFLTQVDQQLMDTRINICFDSPRNWRRQEFPEYKAARKTKRVNDDFDWNYFYDLFEALKEDLSKIIPLYICTIDNCEADDVIAEMVLRIAPVYDEFVIVSSDKDMLQLLEHASIYNPMKKLFMKVGSNPADYPKSNAFPNGYNIVEHIIRGDASDGVPNILSPDDVFVTEGKRNTPIRQAKLKTIKIRLYDYLHIHREG